MPQSPNPQQEWVAHPHLGLPLWPWPWPTGLGSAGQRPRGGCPARPRALRLFASRAASGPLEPASPVWMAARLGTSGRSTGKGPAWAAGRWAPGLGHRTLFRNRCPHGFSRPRCLADTWVSPCRGESELGRRGYGPLARGSVSLSSVKWALPRRLLMREQVTTHAIKRLRRWLALHQRQGDFVLLLLLVSPSWGLLFVSIQTQGPARGWLWFGVLVPLLIHTGTSDQPHHLSEPQISSAVKFTIFSVPKHTDWCH